LQTKSAQALLDWHRVLVPSDFAPQVVGAATEGRKKRAFTTGNQSAVHNPSQQHSIDAGTFRSLPAVTEAWNKYVYGVAQEHPNWKELRFDLIDSLMVSAKSCSWIFETLRTCMCVQLTSCRTEQGLIMLFMAPSQANTSTDFSLLQGLMTEHRLNMQQEMMMAYFLAMRSPQLMMLVSPTSAPEKKAKAKNPEGVRLLAMMRGPAPAPIAAAAAIDVDVDDVDVPVGQEVRRSSRAPKPNVRMRALFATMTLQQVIPEDEIDDERRDAGEDDGQQSVSSDSGEDEEDSDEDYRQ
jgi:hypothetical protein